MSIADLARATGLTHSRISMMYVRNGVPRRDALELIARALGVAPSYLLTGLVSGAGRAGEEALDGPLPALLPTAAPGSESNSGPGALGLSDVASSPGFFPNQRALPLYDLQDISMGMSGSLTYDEPLEMRTVAPELIEGAQGHVALVRAEGAAMAPTIGPGDELIVDFLPTGIPRAGIYLIEVDDQRSVKELEMLPGKVLMVRCHNPAYPDQTFGPESEISVAILGRVLGLQKRL